MRGETGPIHGDIVAGVALEPPDRVGIELALDPRSHAARLGEGSRVNDLLGRLPLLRSVAHVVRPAGNRVRGLPVDHRLVHPSFKGERTSHING